jgi:hypothetical protein
MKYRELIKFIEDKVKEISASEQNEIVETEDDSSNVQYKPVTINIRRETPKERDLEEKDFEEIMFFKLDEEQELRKKVRAIIKESEIVELFLGDEEKKMPLLIKKGNPKKMESTTVYDSFADSLDAAVNFIESKKFEVDENSWFNGVTAGAKEPMPGETNRYAIELTRGGEYSGKRLHMQISAIDGGKYQLSAYIS